MIVADTDVLIDFLKGGTGAADRVAMELKLGLHTTVISVFELWNGAAGSLKRASAVETLLDCLKIIPCRTAAAKQAAEIRYTLQKQGRTLAPADALIAGICVTERAMLLTRNIAHFADIEGLYLGKLTP